MSVKETLAKVVAPSMTVLSPLSYTKFGKNLNSKIGEGLLGEKLNPFGDTDATKARKAQEKLEAQRKAQLASEASDREAAKKRAESSGQRVGLGSSFRSMLVGGGFGAGSGDTMFGSGSGNLYGN